MNEKKREKRRERAREPEVVVLPARRARVDGAAFGERPEHAARDRRVEFEK